MLALMVRLPVVGGIGMLALRAVHVVAVGTGSRADDAETIAEKAARLASDRHAGHRHEGEQRQQAARKSGHGTMVRADGSRFNEFSAVIREQTMPKNRIATTAAILA